MTHSSLNDVGTHTVLTGLLSAGNRYNITPLVPVTPYDEQGLWLVIAALIALTVNCVVRLSHRNDDEIPVRKTPADLFAEGRGLLEKAIILYAEENPQGFSNAAIGAALCADPDATGDQKGWITYKYINALCASGTLERVEVFEESDERLTKTKFARAKLAFLKRSECDSISQVPSREWALFLSSPRIQRRYLKPSILYRKR